MLILVTGASASGKSNLAEVIASEFFAQSDRGRLIYAACMKIRDREDEIRIERHRELRAERGFITVEKSIGIGKISVDKEDVILIECMSNLLANEMYDKDLGKSEDLPDKNTALIDADESVYEQNNNVCNRIVSDIQSLCERTKCVVLVSNEVFSDGIAYDSECEKYISNLGEINIRIAKMADRVIESVVGIPVVIK